MQTSIWLQPMPRRLLAVAAFKANWLLLVVGQERWLGWAALVLTLQLLLCLTAVRGMALRKLVQVLVFAGLGIALDSALSYSGLLLFTDAVVPPWLCLLWLACACVLMQLLDVLQRATTALLALAGAVAGAAGYGGGALLGAVVFGGAPGVALALIALLWSGVLPLAATLFAFPGGKS